MNPQIDSPFDYQWEGALFLSTHHNALLADDMGLGKTVQVILAADVVDAKKILVIGPAIARFNWQNEFSKWGKRERNFKVILGKDDCTFHFEDSVICSFDFASENKEMLAVNKWDLIVVDEVHMLKNHTSKRTHSFFNNKDGIIKNCKYFWALSGTPCPNSNITELWVLLRTCGITKYTYDEFVEAYCTWYMFNGKKVVSGNRPEKINEIKKMLSRIMLRRKTEDVLKQLPKIFTQDLVVEAGPVDFNSSQAFVSYTFPIDRRDILAGKLTKEEALINATGFDINKMIATAKSVSTIRKYTGLQKVVPMCNLIKEEMAAGLYDKVVIFAVHKDTIEAVRFELHDFKPVIVYGGTPPLKREMHVKNFQTNPKCQVFIGNIQAAGTNIKLTAAHELFLLEPSWVPGDNVQAIKRCNRIGSTKPLRVRVVALVNSIDQKIGQVLRKKTMEALKLFDEKNPLQNEWDDVKDEELAEMLK